MKYLAFSLLLFSASVPTAASSKGVHPIVHVSQGYLLGGVVNGKFVSAADMKNRVIGGESHRIYSLHQLVGTSVGGKIHVDAPGDTHYIDLKPPSRGSNDRVGICADWNPLPRKPRLESVRQKAYQDAVRAVLNSKGLTGAKVNVTQVIRVDLEGDRQDEVIIGATTPRPGYPQPDSKKNDYSVVLLRKIITGTVKSFVVEGNFYTKFVRFNAPNAHKVASVLDFGGDGVMEVAVSSSYFEGGDITIYSVRSGKLVRLLSGGSGA